MDFLYICTKLFVPLLIVVYIKGDKPEYFCLFVTKFMTIIITNHKNTKEEEHNAPISLDDLII